MPEFSYLAQDFSGRQVTGSLVAPSRRDAASQLASRTLVPLQLEEKAAKPAGRRRRWTAMHYGQLSDLLRTGVPLLKALEVLRDQANAPEQQSLFQEMRDGLADGASLSEVMQGQREAFDPIAVGIVQAGEEGGFLEEALRRIAVLQERSDEFRGRLCGALIYPLVLVSVGSLLVLGLLVFFVPNFAPIFERLAAQGQLPWATRVLITASNVLRGHGWWIALGGAGLLLTFGSSLDLGAARAAVLSRLARLRFAGAVVRETITARFCRVLGTLLKNDVPMVRALRITRNAVGDSRFAQVIDQAVNDVADGGRLATHLTNCCYLPADITAMVAVGEQANTLETVLLDAADILERRSSRRLDLYLKLLEPALLLFLAGVVLFLVIGLMLPIFDASGVQY